LVRLWLDSAGTRRASRSDTQRYLKNWAGIVATLKFTLDHAATAKLVDVAFLAIERHAAIFEHGHLAGISAVKRTLVIGVVDAGGDIANDLTTMSTLSSVSLQLGPFLPVACTAWMSFSSSTVARSLAAPLRIEMSRWPAVNTSSVSGLLSPLVGHWRGRGGG
jgi:hypothetical protein